MRFTMHRRQCAKCGEWHARKGPKRFQSYCEDCHAAYMRTNRPKHSELTAEQKFKSNARAYANVYQRRGMLIRKPCIKCGAKNSEKHHHDYSKPLQIDWMCRNCHLTLHRIENDSSDTAKAA